MKSTNKFYEKKAFTRVFFLVGTITASLGLFAQEPSLDIRLETASIALAELDDKAKFCLNAIEQPDAGNLVNCDDFLKAVDGKLLARYLASCEALKIWRDDFVNDQTLIPNDAEKNLRVMRGIEFSCGENAIQKRTKYVSKAIELLQNNFQDIQRDARVNLRISEIQLNQLNNRERRSLESDIVEQNQRVRSETNQQQRELKTELLRQEIFSPPFPGN